MFANAELRLLQDDDLKKVDGQSGITLSASIVLGADSRISYTSDYDNVDYNPTQVDKAYWMVFKSLQGGIAFENLKFDLTDTFSENGSESALQWTLPEKVEFSDLKIEGLYLSDSVNAPAGVDRRYLLSVGFDGALQLPAETKLYVFPVNN
jgi:hypothetical protein